MTPDQTRPGRLFVLATPIGNLGDLTHRAAQTLAQVDLVAAEDTRRTRKLISHLGIKVELISYREQNRAAAGSRILAALEQGRDVGLVSDAGTPVVSDPGADLVARAVEAGLTVIPIPGPSAVAAALSISGFQADCYTFGGFLPAKAKARQEFLEELALRREPLVFFEAPHRLAKSLGDILSVMGPRRAVLCRELTKVNEEIVRGDLKKLVAWADGADRIRGEITLVLAGAPAQAPLQDRETVLRAWQEIRSRGISPSQAAKEVAARAGMSRSEVYTLGLDHEQPSSSRETGAWAEKTEQEPGPERRGMQESPAIQISRKFTVTNTRGLHARSATRIIQLLQQFECKAWFVKNGQTVEGDSILSLLTLNCPRGSVVEVRMEGDQAEDCLDKLGLLFARNFDEE